ncbi:hypothetical protein DV515_00018058, partial [Chloebia gouldiae]
KRKGKLDEVAYIDLFFYLRDKPEWQVECGLMVVKASTSGKCGVCVKEKGCLECLALKASLSRRNDTDVDLQIGWGRMKVKEIAIVEMKVNLQYWYLIGLEVGQSLPWSWPEKIWVDRSRL